jgi:hypothetical protein
MEWMEEVFGGDYYFVYLPGLDQPILSKLSQA